jgi:predicted ribonuclease toxin of YeeF-YezG toxin-antitoxin module
VNKIDPDGQLWIWDKAKQVVKGAAEKGKRAVKKVVDKGAEVAKAAVETVKEAGQAVVKTGKSIVHKGAEIASSGAKKVKRGIATAGAKAKKKKDKIVRQVKESGTRAKEKAVVAAKVVRSYGSGVVDAGVSAIQGIGAVLDDPGQAAKNIGNAVLHPVLTGQAIWDEISTAFTEDVINGDRYSRARFAGRLTGELALILVGTKGVDKAAKAAKAANLSEKAGEAARIFNRLVAEETGSVNLNLLVPKRAGRAAEGISSYTKSNLKLGKQMHKAYKTEEVVPGVKLKEYILPSGKRPDFIDFENKVIYELKPYNPRGIKQGHKQLEMYRNEIESIGDYGTGWRTQLDTY